MAATNQAIVTHGLAYQMASYAVEQARAHNNMERRAAKTDAERALVGHITNYDYLDALHTIQRALELILE